MSERGKRGAADAICNHARTCIDCYSARDWNEALTRARKDAEKRVREGLARRFEEEAIKANRYMDRTGYAVGREYWRGEMEAWTHAARLARRGKLSGKLSGKGKR